MKKLRFYLPIGLIGLMTPQAALPCWKGAESDQECYVARVSNLVDSTDQKERIEKLVQTTLDPSVRTKFGQDLYTSIPSGTVLDRVETESEPSSGTITDIRIYLKFTKEFEESAGFTEHRINEIGQEFIHLLREEGISNWYLYLYDRESDTFIEPYEAFPEEPVTWKPPVDHATVEMAKKQGKVATRDIRNLPVINPNSFQGSLSGKTVFINQSHGWFDDFEVVNRWRVQRGDAFGTLEDFDSGEFINQYVLPLLRNAGAKVMTVRESDHQTNMVIVDNADGTSNPSNGTYVETGSWADSSLNGFKQKTGASWNGVNINPFNQGSGENRLSDGLTSGDPTATATWTAVIPEDGYYNVYASWTGFSGRASDAQYLVHHSGGVSEVRMNQTIDGYTWVLLGNWYFEAGAPEDQRKVVLTNHSNDNGAVNVSADAVRWGGGMGDVARHSSGISGRPRWEEEAVNYLQFNGFGYSGNLYTGNDDESGGWSDRPQYARWEHSIKDGSVEDAVYFAWHTNAFNGNARGLVTFRHGSTATADSATFQTIMHDKAYNAINTLWFTGETWTVRPKSSQNFGENNQNSLGQGIPGFLFEGLFHDNEEDSTAYNEPEFRYIMARAITQGVIDYFNDRDNASLIYPPETPRNLLVEYTGSGEAEISWAPPVSGGFNGGAATSYRVHQSSNGFGFDDGFEVNGTSTILTGLEPGETVYIRVSALNSGGSSLPTETLAVKRGFPNLLIVNGFDRNQRSQIPTENITNAGVNLRRHVPTTFQAFNYIIEHAEAIEHLDYSISSASNEAVAAQDIDLNQFDGVIWISGEESTSDDTFSPSEQGIVESYINQGGNLFVSGAEIGWDLGRDGSSSAADISFYENVLKTSYFGDDAGTYNVASPTEGPFMGMSAFNFSPASGARYDAEFPDVLETSGGSEVALQYTSNGVAAVYYDGDYRLISMGFPFELISDASVRREFMEKSMLFLVPIPGDTSVNGTVSELDAMLLNHSLIGTGSLDGQSLRNADTNFDNLIDISDRNYIIERTEELE